MKLVTLNYGITTTTKQETASAQNPQCNADTQTELLHQYQDVFQESDVSRRSSLSRGLEWTRWKRTWCPCLARHHIESKWAHWLGKLVSLCHQEQWYTSAAVRRFKRPQSSHQAATLLHRDIGWCPSEIELSPILLHRARPQWILEYQARSWKLPEHNLQLVSCEIKESLSIAFTADGKRQRLPLILCSFF